MVAEFTVDLAQLRNLEEECVVVLLQQHGLGGGHVGLERLHHLPLPRERKKKTLFLYNKQLENGKETFERTGTCSKVPCQFFCLLVFIKMKKLHPL